MVDSYKSEYNASDELQEKTQRMEQAHLKEVYACLVRLHSELEEKIDKIRGSVQEERKNIWDDMTLNFDSDVNAQETYAEFEVMNHVIDGYNIMAGSLSEELERVKMLEESAYFAKIRLRFDPEEEPEDLYIGRAEVRKNSRERMIIDWRSPVAETYYNQENGKTSYMADGRKIEAELLLRRQFEIRRDRLLSFFDTTIAIQDPLLLSRLSRDHNGRMQAITATIQKEQNAVIRYPSVPAILVNGIAGSGKTSVLLQRIAYLLYRERKTLRPENVVLITLNPVFGKYIENVLPDLGETNPVTMTMADFLESEGAGRSAGYKTSAEDLKRLSEAVSGLTFEAGDLAGIRQSGEEILSAGRILKILGKYGHIAPGPRLFGIAQDALEEEVRRIGRRKRNEDRDGRGKDAGESRGRGKRGDEENTAESRDIENRYGGALSVIRNFHWLRFDRIGRRILHKEKLSSLEWIWLKMELTGVCDRSTRYVCIDEVQDYTPAQLMVLEKFYPNARFLLLGDENQSIREGTVSFAGIRELFAARGKECKELPLMTSYRATPEITALFSGLLEESDRIRISSVRETGTEPVILSGLRDGYDAAFRSALGTGDTPAKGLTAVIARNGAALAKAAERAGIQARIIRKEDELPDEGIIFMELATAKGLEFDHVILPDADEMTYPSDKLSRNCLYTAISRATQKVTILAEGELTPLLAGCESRGQVH